MIGKTVGSFQITDKLGAGGMGEVYRARDTRLNRDVAIKVLPELFAADADRLARFTREAQVLAALNHPNIAAIYGMEDRALVMELVEGADLSAVIARGPLPLSDALPIARQIADALEAAHDQGIVHRDLKPANVKVRADGTVKVLDFGLAKALAPESASGSGDAANSPTLTARATQMGMVIGTAAYMAPEQARGRAVDRRADIWAFGVVLYEMLAGKRAFGGDDISITLANVLKEDVDWEALPADLPAPVRRLLRRCLEKDPRKRLSAVGDARLELDEREPAVVGPAAAAVAARPSLVARLWPALAGVVLTAGVAAFFWPSAGADTGKAVARLSVMPPPGEELYPDSTGVVVSPDGTMVAFIVGNVAKTATELWVRSLDSMTARRLDDAEGATVPFWSPDSRRIGFFTTSKLKTIAASGGRADVLADSPGGRGGDWNRSNTIVYAPDAGGPLFRIPASGGTPEPATKLDADRKEFGHRFPAFLPDGDHFLYAALPGKAGKFDIFAGSLSDDSKTLVGSLESAPIYAEPGWLLYVRQGVLVAHPFDPDARKLTGDPVSLGDEPTSILDPATSFTAGRAISMSDTGSLAYFSSPSTNTTATWYDALGRNTGTLDLPPGHYETVSISPDGTRAVFVRSTSPSESALWLVDLARGGAAPLSTGRGRNDGPVWSPDSRRVAFAADRDGPQDVFVKTIDDASPEQPLYRSDVPFKGPLSWSPDGQWIVMAQLDPGAAQNIWLLPAAGQGQLTKFLAGPAREIAGPASPDGRWLAYASDDTGQSELYVQPFPKPGPKVQVSHKGATTAWWKKDGTQILFLGTDLRTLWRADVERGAAFRAGAPRLIATLPAGIVWVDAMPDRERFLAIAPERTGIGSVTVVQNWRAALEKAR
jgi:Tol biopolymer transport system component